MADKICGVQKVSGGASWDAYCIKPFGHPEEVHKFAPGQVVAKPHDPYPIKVHNKGGKWVTSLPMSGLGYHMPHEVQAFAPDAEFCQQPGHYFTALSAALGGGE